MCLCLAAAVALIGSGQTLAATGHSYLSSLSEAPPGTKLLAPEPVAVNRSTGELFVADGFSGYIDIYDSSGSYEKRFGEGVVEAVGMAVDESNGDVYVAPAESTILVYEPDGKGGYRLLGEWAGLGTPGKAFGEVTGIAVDNSKGSSAGDLYVVESEGVETEGGVVDVFKPAPNPKDPEEVEEGEGEEGQYLKRLKTPKLEEPNGVAVSPSTGRVLVADSPRGAIYAFGASGAFEEKLTGKGSPGGSFKGPEEEEGNVAAVAVDESTGEIYVAEAERHVVSEYSSTGLWEGWITNTPTGPLAEPRGVALSTAGNLYVADAGLALVDVFSPGVVVPDVATTKASKVARTTAILGGTINGDGKAGKYFFQWGTTAALGQSTPITASGPGEEKVSATLTELHAGTSYFFRIVGENENGANYGSTREFTTPPAVEGVSTGPVQNLQPNSATLTGALKPGGFDAHYYFQWGTSTAYGNDSPEAPGTDAGSGIESVAAKTDLSGLGPNTVYHYRIVTENIFGTTFGADQKFSTSGPPRITSKPTTAIGHEEATINAEVNPDEIATTYHFEYGETTAYGSEVPIGGASIGSGASPVAVSAPLSKLKLGVSYHFRVIAANEAGTTTGPDQKFTTIAPAPIDATYATDVGATTATLHTQINPLGHDTHYFFQYGSESCTEHPASCTSIPAPPGEDIGAGEEDVAKSVELSGLKPSTTYHFRVLASNSLGTTEGAERTLTTQTQEGSFALADDRSWELVTPPNKHGAPVEALTRAGGWILAAEDGNSLTYVANGSVVEQPEANRSPEQQQVIATRTPGGWSSQDIATEQTGAEGISAGNAPEYQFFTADLSHALVEPWARAAPAEPPLAADATQATMYIRDSATGAFTTLVTAANVAPGTEFGLQLRFVDATPDLSHVVIASKVGLTGAGSGQGLYEWSNGQLQFVSLLPDGAPGHEAELGFFRVAAHAISNDGSRVIWTTSEENTHRGHLYMRDTAHGETIQLDAAQGLPEPSKGSAQFQTASSDGSKVFFTDKQRLTADSTAEPAGIVTKPDLYECEIVESAGKLTCALKDLTVDHNEGEHAAVQTFLLGASDDQSRIYFVAQGVLAGNENGNGESAEAAKNNLYELHFDGAQWTTTFIAGLSSEDKAEWEGELHGNSAYVTARVSPNGRYLAFMSAASPTGYDNVDATPEAKGARDEEVYLYDSTSASLRCVSCNPTGQRPKGVFDAQEAGEGLGLVADRREVWAGHWIAGNIPGWTAQSLVSALYQSRYLSDEGRMYFNSPDELVPQAKNGKENVYEYEPSGLGSCTSPSGGCVSLISGGESDRESAFMEATPDGSDVFFITEGRLLSQDTDTAFDIYDARVCTPASPCLTPPEPPPPGCVGSDACRPAPPAQPIPGGPGGTATFSGAGNAVPPAKQQVQDIKAGTNPKAKPLTRAQKLAKAMKACKKQHSKNKRKACEAHARKLYGPKSTATKSARADKHAKGSTTSGRRSSGRGGR